MNNNRLEISINRPPAEVFAFTADPQNTPRWIGSIAIEEINESPPRLGTIYRNRGHGDEWSEYKMTEFDPPTAFTLSQIDGDYHVRYAFEPAPDNGCDFTYHEWVDEGELSDPFAQESLGILKALLEQD